MVKTKRTFTIVFRKAAKAALKIEHKGKGLTQEISGDKFLFLILNVPIRPRARTCRQSKEPSIP